MGGGIGQCIENCKSTFKDKPHDDETGCEPNFCSKLGFRCLMLTFSVTFLPKIIKSDSKSIQKSIRQLSLLQFTFRRTAALLVLAKLVRHCLVL